MRGLTLALALAMMSCGPSASKPRRRVATAQDVAPRAAGRLLGLTNTCATLAGIAANLLAGRRGGAAGGFRPVFGVTAALYLASLATFSAFARGRAL